MARHRIEPVQPSPEAFNRMRWLLRLGRPIGEFIIGRNMTITTSGQETFPQEGAVLLVANHVCEIDPGMLLVRAGRPIQFMTSQSALVNDFQGRLIAAFGVIPKKKFQSDSKAVKLMVRWAQLGAAVGLFPEGQRSWDGHTLPPLPGIEKLVRLVGAPVVTARILNGARVWPRWAPKPRKGRVHIEFDAPHAFDKRTPPAQILEHLVSHMKVDPLAQRDWPVRGTDLAVGLANLLHACPACNAIDVMQERGDVLGCPRCGASWTVTTELELRGAGGAGDMLISEAWALLKERFAETWVADPARFARNGVVLESEPMTLLDTTDAEAVEVGKGRLQLTAEGLRLDNGTWSLPFEELVATTVEYTRRLAFFSSERIYEAVLPTESVVKWEWIVPHWHQRHGA